MTLTAEVLAWIGPCVGKPRGYERIVRLLVPPEKCAHAPERCLSRDGTLFLTRPGIPLGWYVTFFGTYEPELRKIIRILLPPGGVAVDVGANIGWHTLLMARQVGTDGRVLAIEANPSVRSQLERNVDLNRLAHVEIVPHAAAECAKTVRFFGPGADDPRSGDGHIVTEEDQQSQLLSIESRTLDAIVMERPINRLDLIKIDVEGYEWPVLQGGERTIANFRPYILFEFDSVYARRGGGNGPKLAEFFGRHDYRILAIARSELLPVGISNWPDGINFVAVPAERRSPYFC
jgi:FkbM family methyltransferase